MAHQPSDSPSMSPARQIAQRLGPGKTVVVVFPDGGERYFSAEAYFEPSPA